MEQTAIGLLKTIYGNCTFDYEIKNAIILIYNPQAPLMNA